MNGLPGIGILNWLGPSKLSYCLSSTLWFQFNNLVVCCLNHISEQCLNCKCTQQICWKGNLEYKANYRVSIGDRGLCVDSSEMLKFRLLCYFQTIFLSLFFEVISKLLKWNIRDCMVGAVMWSLLSDHKVPVRSWLCQDLNIYVTFFSA